MGRKVDPKTSTLYVYVLPDNHTYVKKMRQYFGSESNYIDALITHDMKRDVLKTNLLRKQARDTKKAITAKKNLLKKLERDAEKLVVLRRAHDE